MNAIITIDRYMCTFFFRVVSTVKLTYKLLSLLCILHIHCFGSVIALIYANIFRVSTRNARDLYLRLCDSCANKEGLLDVESMYNNNNLSTG